MLQRLSTQVRSGRRVRPDMNADRLRVLMVSTSYPSTAQDWKGRFIFDMAAALSRRSDVDIALWVPPGELPAGTASVAAGDDEVWLGRLLERGGIAHLLPRLVGNAAAGVSRQHLPITHNSGKP